MGYGTGEAGWELMRDPMRGRLPICIIARMSRGCSRRGERMLRTTRTAATGSTRTATRTISYRGMLVPSHTGMRGKLREQYFAIEDGVMIGTELTPDVGGSVQPSTSGQ